MKTGITLERFSSLQNFAFEIVTQVAWISKKKFSLPELVFKKKEWVLKGGRPQLTLFPEGFHVRFRMTFQSVVEPARPPHGVKDPVKDWGRREVSLPFAGGDQKRYWWFFLSIFGRKTSWLKSHVPWVLRKTSWLKSHVPWVLRKTSWLTHVYVCTLKLSKLSAKYNEKLTWLTLVDLLFSSSDLSLLSTLTIPYLHCTRIRALEIHDWLQIWDYRSVDQMFIAKIIERTMLNKFVKFFLKSRVVQSSWSEQVKYCWLSSLLVKYSSISSSVGSCRSSSSSTCHGV